MTTHHLTSNNDTLRPSVDPIRPDLRRCDCGATADHGRRCDKCRARVRWHRRRSTGRSMSQRHRPASRRTSANLGSRA